MSSQVKSEGRTFWSEKEAYIYPLNYLLPTHRCNVIYYKSVHHPIPNLPVGTGSTLTIFKINQYTLLSIEFQDIFCSCLNWKGKKCLFWKVARRGITLHNYHLVDIRHENVSSFVKFEIILPLLCFLLDPLTSKHCRTCSYMINLWIDSKTCQK